MWQIRLKKKKKEIKCYGGKKREKIIIKVNFFFTFSFF